MSKRRTTALLALVFAASTLSAREAMGGPGTEVSSVNLSASSVKAGTTVGVTGTVAFGADVRVIATDPPGDVPPHQVAAGMDLLEARIASDPAKPNEMVWTLKTAGLPPLLAGMPEVVFYWWPFTTSEALAYDARRTNVYRQPNANPFFRIRRCPGGTCSDVATPAGVFDEVLSEIRATIKVSSLPGAKDAPILMDDTIESSHGTGARWIYGLGDLMVPEVEEYRAPSPDVRVGIAVPGGDPAVTTAATVGPGATTSYNAPLSTAGFAPGPYDVVVKACWGLNCGSARAPLTIT